MDSCPNANHLALNRAIKEFILDQDLDCGYLYNFGDISFPSPFPPADCSFSLSDSIAYPPLQGNLQKPNPPNFFLFHSSGSNPCVIIDFSFNIYSFTPIYLYNRCDQSNEEISKRIIGCSFSVSSDQVNWEELNLIIAYSHIYMHEAIEICFPNPYRYLRIQRVDGKDSPIHLSQIMIGASLSDVDSLLRFNLMLLAKKVGLKHEAYEHLTIANAPNSSISLEYHGGELSVRGLFIIWCGRFSNFIMQLMNAIYFAFKIGLNKVYIAPCEITEFLFPGVQVVSIEKYSVDIVISRPTYGISVNSMFFMPRASIPSVYDDAPPMRDFVNCFKYATRFCHISSEASTHCKPNHLTIHIRSGDIFTNNGISSLYGQPPLAYYLQVINHMSPMSITLVYENLNNPVIEKLIERINCMNIPMTVSSSNKLSDDIETLIQAEVLVIGFGTFAQGVLCFSDVLHTIYSFHHPFSREIFPERHRASASSYVVKDTQGIYIRDVMSENWANTAYQRQLMIDYPVDSLIVVES